MTVLGIALSAFVSQGSLPVTGTWLGVCHSSSDPEEHTHQCTNFNFDPRVYDFCVDTHLVHCKQERVYPFPCAHTRSSALVFDWSREMIISSFFLVVSPCHGSDKKEQVLLGPFVST